MSHAFYRRVLALGTLLAFVAASAQAVTRVAQTGGLGESWPNTQDVSANPRLHVHVFVRDGVEYVQINDLNGTVHAAFATANGQVLRLPIGSDSSRVSTSQQPQAGTSTANSEIVYRDNQISVSMAPQADGISWQVLPTSPPSSRTSNRNPTASACESCGGSLMAQ